MRYRADGTLDTTFGSGGRVTVAAASFGGTTAQVYVIINGNDTVQSETITFQ